MNLLLVDYSFSISDFLIYALGLILTFTLFIIQRQKRTIKEISARLYDKKYNLYNEVLSLFFDILKGKDSKDIDELATEIGHRIIDVKKELLLYAPDHILKKFIEWSNFATNNTENNRKHIQIFIEVMTLVRKDMGHPKTAFNEEDFWKLIMKSDQDIQLMKASLL